MQGGAAGGICGVCAASHATHHRRVAETRMNAGFRMRRYLFFSGG